VDKSSIRELLPRFLIPGWPDEARGVVQRPLFDEAARIGRPRGRCLNAGCGEGLFSPWLESFGEITEIVNVDIDEPDISRRRSDPRHTDSVGSVTGLPIEDRSIDWVLCTEVIEHVEDDHAAVRELARVMKPESHALISVPRPPAPFDPNHARAGYSLQEMTDLLSAGGLDVLWHSHCFRMPMRWLVVIWRWQHETLLRGRRNLMPRFVVSSFAYADRLLPFGRPWDLVVLARREQ
jgi:SAM-dependent methyltransferase